MTKRKSKIETLPAKYDIERNGGVPKLIVLRQERDAAEAAEDAAARVDDRDAWRAAADAAGNADRAFRAEMDAAQAMRVRFEAEFNEADQDSGLVNAQDTAGERGWWKAYGQLVEFTTEYWGWAICSAEFARDQRPA